MRNTVFGFSQELLCQYKLDLYDAALLRWFVDFSPRMNSFSIDGSAYYWVNYQKVIDDLPCLEINNKRTIARRFDNLVTAGILTKKVTADHTHLTCFQLTDKYLTLLLSYKPVLKSTPPVVEQQPMYSKVQEPVLESTDGMDAKVHTQVYDLLVNNLLVNTDKNIKAETDIFLEVKNKFAGSVVDVYETWCTVMSKQKSNKQTLTQALNRIKALLDLKYDPEDLKKVIIWAKSDDFMSKNGYLDTENLFVISKFDVKLNKAKAVTASTNVANSNNGKLTLKQVQNPNNFANVPGGVFDFGKVGV